MTPGSTVLTLKVNPKRLPAWDLAHLSMGCGILAVTLGMMLAPTAAWAQPPTDAPAMQSSSAQGVTVQATLKSAGTTGNRWEFAVVFDTHSAELSDDLTQSASLTTNDGRTLQPVSWTGAPAGGHHREGVLVFDAPAPRPSTIELRIARQGESTARIFRWQL